MKSPFHLILGLVLPLVPVTSTSPGRMTADEHSVLASCVLERTTSATLGSGWPAISFDSEINDPLGMHDATNPTRITIPANEGGVYEFSFVIPAGSQAYQFRLYKNGVALGPAVSAASGSGVMHFLDNAAAGDYFEAWATCQCIPSFTLAAGARFSALKTT